MDGGILDWSYKTITGIPERRPELVAEAADVRDILMLAIKLEKGSHDFYMVARDTAIYKEIASQAFYIAGQSKTQDPGAKALMKELAQEELRHMGW